MRSKFIYTLSDYEEEVIVKGLKDPDYITDYFFRKPGATTGWLFDFNFDPQGAWQKTLHLAKQKRITMIGGFGTGKTRGVAMSAFSWAVTTRDFRFMNVAPVAWQSELMYQFLEESAEDTPAEKLIVNKVQRPYPKIEIAFYFRGTLVRSKLEFMSVDKNASKILSWEGDWINVDEAGLIDNLDDISINLGSRLRGSVNGRARLGRLSFTSNSWENYELWRRFDLANAEPDLYLSMVISTRHNHNVTKDQLKVMLKDIPESEHERYIDGTRPQGRGNYFSESSVYNAESKIYGDLIQDGADRIEERKKNEPGITISQDYWVTSRHGMGVTDFGTPAQKLGAYMVFGDPGTGQAPMRNAPTIMVWDVTDFPEKKAVLSSFWWGSGDGKITPFVNKMLTLMSFYNPIYTAIDNTSTQKHAAQLLNVYLPALRDRGENEFISGVDLARINNIKINGLDFSGGMKNTFLISGKLFIEAQLCVWPQFCSGIRSQLLNYDPEKDSINSKTTIAQDIVAAFCMSAYAIRYFFRIDPASMVNKNANQNTLVADYSTDRNSRLDASERSRETDIDYIRERVG
jgi:hypothetical protein